MSLLIALVAASSAAAVRCPPADEAGVRAAFEQWVASYRARDLAGTMAIFDPNVRFEAQGSPDGNWTTLREGYRRSFAAQAGAEWRATWDQIIVSGNMAAAFATWRAYAPGADTPRAENRSVDTLVRGENCRWRIVRSLTYPLRARG